MLILALDTTTRAGSVAVTDDDTVLALVHGDATHTHGERLPGEMERALAAAGVAPTQLALLAVASGPGAFTGMRIGLAAVQGMAMVLDIPVIGVSALDALASEAWAARNNDERHVIAWIDAQRGEVFAAHYEDRSSVDGEGEPTGELPAVAGGPARAARPEGEPGPAVTAAAGPTRAARPAGEAGPQPVVGTPDAVLRLVDVGVVDAVLCVGDGAVRYRTALKAHYQGRCRVIDTPVALAPAIARLGRRRAERRQAGPPHTLRPLYVRRPDAELERQRRRDS